MKLTLHAGTHKTGTTTIQHVLQDNREWLRSQGLFVTKRGKGMGHLNFCKSVSILSETEQKKASSFINRAKKEMQSHETMIISAEQIYRRVTMPDADMSDHAQWMSLLSRDYWERRHDYLERLAQSLQDFDVEVVLCFRSHDYFMGFLHYTLVKHHCWDDTLYALEEQFGDRFSYGRQIEVFMKHFDNVRIFRFETAVNHGLVKYFFERIGFPAPPHAETVWRRRASESWSSKVSKLRDERS